MFPSRAVILRLLLVTLFLAPTATAWTFDRTTPEGVLRILVQANVAKDLTTISELMAHDSDAVSYTIEGRKYVGWANFAKDMQDEFDAVAKLDIPITQLTIWTRGDVAWFAMELDYVRYVGSGQEEVKMVLPLRETGVMERRNGQWILVTFHESFRSEAALMPSNNQAFPSLQ